MASMGPGSFDPGSMDVRDRMFEYWIASMGPGSFDPGSHRRGSSSIAACMLQWGRGLSTPEVGAADSHRHPRGVASMGPGSFDPGSSITSVRLNLPASLQWGRGLSTPEVREFGMLLRKVPGFNGAGVFRPRKCRIVRQIWRIESALQWGRGLSTPEVAPPPRASASPPRLQWGRGLSTPEVHRHRLRPLHALELQWGRGLSTPEVSGFESRTYRGT